MDLRVKQLALSLSQEQKEYLISHAFSHPRFSHKTVERKDDYGIDVVAYTDPMIEFVTENILSKFAFQPWRWALFSNEPHVVLPPHRDHRKMERWTSVVFPIYPEKENYALCNRSVGPNPRENPHLEEFAIPYMNCYMFDTQTFHSVYNNEHQRINLQLYYKVDFDDMLNIHKEGKLLA